MSFVITNTVVPTIWSEGEGITTCSVISELQNGPAEYKNLACVDILYAEIVRSAGLLQYIK